MSGYSSSVSGTATLPAKADEPQRLDRYRRFGTAALADSIQNELRNCACGYCERIMTPSRTGLYNGKPLQEAAQEIGDASFLINMGSVCSKCPNRGRAGALLDVLEFTETPVRTGFLDILAKKAKRDASIKIGTPVLV